MLCCVMLCCVALHCVVSRCVVLCCIVLWRVVLCHFVLCCVAFSSEFVMYMHVDTLHAVAMEFRRVSNVSVFWYMNMYTFSNKMPSHNRRGFLARSVCVNMVFCEYCVSGCLVLQLVEGAESVGSWPALSEVAQKARKEAEKENKPQCGGGGGGGDGGGGGGGEEGEGGGKVAGKEKKGGSVGGGGGGERRVSGGGGTVGGGGGGGGAMEKANENEANGDGQRFSSRRKGTRESVSTQFTSYSEPLT